MGDDEMNKVKWFLIALAIGVSFWIGFTYGTFRLLKLSGVI